MFKFKGKGFVQITGRNNMANISLNSINGLSNAKSLLNQLNSNTVSMSSHSPWDLTFGNDNTHAFLKKYEMYESTEDVIALACAADRIFNANKIYYKITDRDLYQKIEQQDRDKAKEIKDYYSKKVMMLKLKGSGQLSSFRTDMNTLIHSDGLLFKENMIGVAYWLPKFYAYDLDMDLVKSQVTHNHNFDEMSKKGIVSVRKLTANLTPLKRLYRVTKRSKTYEYWMKDDVLDAGVVLHLEDKNQLQHLWDYMFDNEKVLKIDGNYTRRHRDGFEYFSVSNWTIDRT